MTLALKGRHTYQTSPKNNNKNNWKNTEIQRIISKIVYKLLSMTYYVYRLF